MSFYQKIVFAITLAIIGITLAIVWICFNSPYSNIFIAECMTIVLGELALGATFIMLLKKSDSVCPYSMAAGCISLAYFLFTLIMIYPACHDIQLKYFILTHVIGLVIAGIAYGIFVLGEHNIQEQEIIDCEHLVGKRTLYLQMKNILNEFQISFHDDLALLRESEKMADNLRFATDSRRGMESVDREIQNTLLAMRTAVSMANVTEYKRQLEQLKRFYHSREEQAKLS